MSLKMLSAQFHGTVDWIGDDGQSVGAYFGPTGEDRCIISGKQVERLLLSDQIHKNCQIAASGKLRPGNYYKSRSGADTACAMLVAAEVEVASPLTRRTQASLTGLLKGVVNYWDSPKGQIKTFFNEIIEGDRQNAVCLVKMSRVLEHYRKGDPVKHQSFVGSLAKDRGFNTTGPISLGMYKNAKGETVGIVNMLPPPEGFFLAE